MIDTLRDVRGEKEFDLFWEKVSRFAESVDVEEPHLPRQRKPPKRFELGISLGHFSTTPKQHYRYCYYEAVDNIINFLEDRFDQPGYRIYCQLEQLLLKASQHLEYDEELENVCTFYKDDFTDKERLHTQLQTFGVNFSKS